MRYIKTLRRLKVGSRCGNCGKEFRGYKGYKALFEATFMDNWEKDKRIEPFIICKDCHMRAKDNGKL